MNLPRRDNSLRDRACPPLRSESKPLIGFYKVARCPCQAHSHNKSHAFVSEAFGVERAQVMTCQRVSLLSSLSIPFQRVAVALLYSHSVLVHDAKITLCGQIAAFCGFRQPARALNNVFGDPLPL
jgi:hypothetical protein